jgi:solute carrier family 25 iron transporter 28/37
MDDYESLGTNSTMTQNAIAGALAGIGEHSIMYPVDSIRVCIFYAELMREFIV